MARYMKYTKQDLARFDSMYKTAQAYAEAYRKSARDCLIRIVAIRKQLNLTDSGAPKPSRFLESLVKLEKGN
ncbi:hypothetical protein LCGC14_1424980 [marine sediment metagenome]|uniref:Uncharacterized protein n=1 Tax=marine sediment metagenome TaxID=412755 RepID=A0A0F9JQP8_9ZZZZ